MKLFKAITIAIFLLIIVVISLNTIGFFSTTIVTTNPNLNNNSTSSNFENHTINSTITIVNNDTTTNPDIPPVGNNAINDLNWSDYPVVDLIGVHTNEVSGPNSIINHSFICFEIDVNIKNPDNTDELYREMAGIVVEIRQIIGPNSSPEVWGLVNGIDSYHVYMMPYDDRIYAIDHYHPFAYKNNVYLLPGDDIYNHHTYTIINNSVIEP